MGESGSSDSLSALRERYLDGAKPSTPAPSRERLPDHELPPPGSASQGASLWKEVEGLRRALATAEASCAEAQKARAQKEVEAREERAKREAAEGAVAEAAELKAGAAAAAAGAFVRNAGRNAGRAPFASVARRGLPRGPLGAPPPAGRRAARHKGFSAYPRGNARAWRAVARPALTGALKPPSPPDTRLSELPPRALQPQSS